MPPSPPPPTPPPPTRPYIHCRLQVTPPYPPTTPLPPPSLTVWCGLLGGCRHAGVSPRHPPRGPMGGPPRDWRESPRRPRPGHVCVWPPVNAWRQYADMQSSLNRTSPRLCYFGIVVSTAILPGEREEDSLSDVEQSDVSADGDAPYRQFFFFSKTYFSS